MEISQQDPFDFNFRNEIQESSFGWSSTRGDSKFTSFRKRKIQDIKNNSFLCEPYEFNMSQWQRQNNPCGSPQGASSLEEMHSCVSTRRLKRRLTPEQRIIKYRNRFRSYKERVRQIQHTSEQLLSTVFREVADELQPCILLDKMYHLELQG